MVAWFQTAVVKRMSWAVTRISLCNRDDALQFALDYIVVTGRGGHVGRPAAVARRAQLNANEPSRLATSASRLWWTPQSGGNAITS